MADSISVLVADDAVRCFAEGVVFPSQLNRISMWSAKLNGAAIVPAHGRQ